MNRYLKKLTSAAVTLTLCIPLLSGCSTKPASLPEASQSGRAQEIDVSVMDFSQKLDLKKPEEPIPLQPNILFLGNSYIYVNDMPGMFSELSRSGGIDAQVFEYSDGGYHLSYFVDPQDPLGAEAVSALQNYTWDYVILQEQSSLSTYPENVETEMLPAATELDALIRQAQGQTAFLMTWAYKNGNEWKENGNTLKTSREEMQTQLADTYIQISQKLDALLAPAGIAFMRCAEAYPDIELWDEEDNMHPTQAGTYLAACILYAALYNETPVGLPFTADLDGNTAGILQQIAFETVLQ